MKYTYDQLETAASNLQMPLAEFRCTCLDEPNYYVGDSGFCWFCELIERLNESNI